ncbi:chromosome segregation protein SMC [Salimicrobium sp. PL1-032A]|uniref:chromosome segregation protein SMC n=1 Tax=Salimicrobium sp. PL1-032A TaxID=3095364 RepID=UPI00326078FD
MFLKQLETAGFKSFADKIDVKFVPGVTAVVGPNGSGKSNITDAIRWVLGEQSARSLRGSKMEDVIFSGSETRHSKGYAEVTLTLDNEDHTLPLEYEEVQVTRRVYRSGESEFYINQEVCRLKDIVDLFMDSGLGREAFSIISQGKVEEILSSKPKDRRVIFEEAAGVLKYKQRKRKAEAKLEETEDNLYRVKDILSEIENRVEPLKEQASIARDYLEKKEELESEEVALLVTQIEDMHEEWRTLEAHIEGQRKQEQELSAKLEQKQAEVKSKREDISRVDALLEETHGRMLQLTKELEGLNGKRELFQEKKKHYEEKKETLENDRVTLREELGSLEETLKTEKERRDEKKRIEKETKKQIEMTASALYEEIDTIEESVESLKADYIDLLNEQAAKRNEKQHLKKRADQLHTNRSDARTNELREDIKRMKDEHQDISEKLTPLETEESQLNQQLKDTEKQWKQTKQSYEEWQQKLYQGYQYMESIRSKKGALEEMKESFAGYFQGVKAVLKARDNGQLSGVEGSVLEKVSIPKPYITAVETALGAQAQHVITEDEASARQSIEWLKKTNQGRATFLPMESIKERSVPARTLEAIRNTNGFVGVASNLIHVESPYTTIIGNLLGHILIADSLETANIIAKQTGRKFKVVTLEGDVVNPGGSMSGGAKSGKSSSLFSQDQELKELTEKVADYEEKMKRAEKKVQSLKEDMNEQRDQLEKMEEKRSEITEKVRAQKEEKQKLQMSIDNHEERLAFLDREYVQQEEEYNKTNEDMLAIDQELNGLEQRIEDTQKEIDRLSKVKDEKEQNKDALKEKEQALKVDLATHQAEARNAEEKVRQMEAEYEQTASSLEKVEESYEELMEFFHSEETKEQLEEKIEIKKKEKERLSSELTDTKEERKTLQNEVEQLDATIRETGRMHSNFVQDLQSKEVKANRLDVELENLLRYLEEEYVTTYEKARTSYARVADVEEATTRVKLIKRGIEELGTVNLASIDEYEEIRERFEFLKGQEEDLLAAKGTLRTVMNEMDEEMERKFKETFQSIRGQFEHVFRQLFGGGKADLPLQTRMTFWKQEWKS